MNNNTVNIRELVTEILLSIDKGEEHSHILLKNVLDKYDYLPQSDKNFIKRVVSGTLEYRVKIDYVIDQFSKTPVNRMKPFIRNLIRMSTYQIMYMDKVPDSAVCNEAVKLAGKRGFKGLQGFVNGVLRGIVRGHSEISWPSEEADENIAISIECSVPLVIVENMLADYGADITKKALLSALGSKSIYVRVDETLENNEVNRITQEWDNNGINYSRSSWLPYAYRLNGADKLSRLECFREGLYTVQDISSMMVADKAGINAGDRVLDMCASPGGKSMHAANKLKLKEMDSDTEPGLVISRDVSDYKVRLIEENIVRLHIDNIDTEVWDATVYDESMYEWADVVIADVPCSGFGVIGRKPDIRYNITQEGLNSIILLQRKILDNAMMYVKPGGTLMFSTCTMRKAENEENTEYILKSGKFELAESRQLFITEDNDGFYIAKFVKK